MNIRQAGTLARFLMDRYLGPLWEFKWSDSEKYYGYVQDQLMIVRLSRPLTKRESREHVEDTILHEIAHALRPPVPDDEWPYHCYRWKSIAKALGAVPVREKYSSVGNENWRMLSIHDDDAQHTDINSDKLPGLLETI